MKLRTPSFTHFLLLVQLLEFSPLQRSKTDATRATCTLDINNWRHRTFGEIDVVYRENLSHATGEYYYSNKRNSILELQILKHNSSLQTACYLGTFGVYTMQLCIKDFQLNAYIIRTLARENPGVWNIYKAKLHNGKYIIVAIIAIAALNELGFY